MTTREPPPRNGTEGELPRDRLDSGQLLTRVQRLEQELATVKRQVGLECQPEPLPQGNVDVLVCRVGRSSVAFLLERVREVVQVPLLVPLPEAPAWVPGLLNLRRSLVPVLDVQARVQGNQRRYELTDLIVVATVEDRPVGFLVQEVLALGRSDGSRMERPRDVPVAPYVMGAIHIGDASVVVLSTATLARLADLPEPPAA